MTQQELDQLISAITQRLQPEQKPNDGIITVNGYKSIYLSRDKEDNAIMYHVNQGEVTFVEGNAIKGRLSRVISYVKNEGDKKTESEKLSVYIECSQAKYRLEVGIDRIAGKDILSDLVTLSSEQLKQPVTIAFKRGDDVVFAKILESERDRSGQNYEHIESKALLEQVQALLS